MDREQAIRAIVADNDKAPEHAALAVDLIAAARRDQPQLPAEQRAARVAAYRAANRGW